MSKPCREREIEDFLFLILIPLLIEEESKIKIMNKSTTNSGFIAAVHAKNRTESFHKSGPPVSILTHRWLWVAIHT